VTIEMNLASARKRWIAIDETRGVAMALVWVSHFALTYFGYGRKTLTLSVISATTRAATPIFILVSGVMLGWLVAARRERFGQLWRRFVDRGVFLLLVAHPIIFVAHLPFAGGVLETLRWEFVTDTIGLCLIVAPGMMFAIRRRARLAAAAALYVASWSVALRWTPHGIAASVEEVLVGALHPHAMSYTFPVLQWLSVYLAASAIGEKLQEAHADTPEAGGRVAARMALALLAAGAAGLLAHLFLRGASPSPGRDILLALTELGRKLPPGPVYVLLYGGAGLALLACLAEAGRRGRLETLRGIAALVGRNSLAAFVAQYFVYYTGIVLVGPTPSPWWPVWLLASSALILAAVWRWDRAGGNRWITVGLASAEPWRSPAPPATPRFE
jgi:uncharacterized membrane protein